MNAPSEATTDQLKELGIALRHSGNPPKAEHPESDLFGEIKRMLDKEKIQYKLFEHEPVFTSEQAAKVRRTPLRQGAKALIMFADNKPIMIVLTADRKVNTKKFKADYKIKDLRMATPEEVIDITGVQIGAVPPFGNIFNISSYTDKKLGENESITFNAGKHTKSIDMQYKDFEKVVKPIIGEFSK